MKLFKLIFFITSLFPLSLCIFMTTQSITLVKDGTTTAGILLSYSEVEIREKDSSRRSTGYKPNIVYIVDDERFILDTKITYSERKYPTGHHFEILYKETDPSSATLSSFSELWIIPIFSFIMFFIFFSIPMVMTIIPFMRKRKIAYLKRNGKKLKATIGSIKINPTEWENDNFPFQIHAHYTPKGRKRAKVYKSDNIWFDPTSHIDGDEITVYVDSNNPKNYWVDTSFLPDSIN